MNYRVEHDSLGEVRVSEDKLWGAQTQRSLENFKIGTEKIPLSVIYSLVQIKKGAALINYNEGKLNEERKEAITTACNQILDGKYDDQFILKVWQTGSGTQTNMNVNEVISHICNQKISEYVHPNDHVNMSQSSNDTFPTAMHMATLKEAKGLLNEAESWLSVLSGLENRYKSLIKIGRTHLQDATPLTFGQEISGWRTMIERNIQQIKESSTHLCNLAIGGTAVGTGLNASRNFGEEVAKQLSILTGLTLRSDDNKFYALTSHSALSYFHGSLRALSGDLMKIANDIRWLASGPRAGFGEIELPANEPGSSIMPGKVNPTQCEAITMVTAQVMGNDTTIQIASSQGNFELNVYKPVIIYNVLQSLELLTSSMESFRVNCLEGIKAKDMRMNELCEQSLMLVTALTPHIGYEKSSEIAKYAFNKDLTLKEATVLMGYATEEDFEQWVIPKNMVSVK